LSKIQELTDKIYSEGVDKARLDAEAIINSAQEKAAAIEKAAIDNADTILRDARKQAAEINSHVVSELRMAYNQSIIALKQEIGSLVTMKALQPGVNELLTRPDYLKTIVVKAIEATQQKEGSGLRVILTEKDKAELERFFKNELANELNKGVKVEIGEGIKSGFKIGPADGSYVISFKEQDLINLFNAYLRPKASELLFENPK